MEMVDIAITAAAGLWEFGTDSRPGDLQADLLGGRGAEPPRKKKMLHFAREGTWHPLVNPW